VKRYNPTERCQKCGGMLDHRTWMPPEDFPATSRGMLAVECSSCGYQTERAPRDAPEEKAARSPEVGGG